MKSTLLFIFFSLSLHLVFSQEASTWDFYLGYSGGSILHPGISFGVETAFSERVKTRKGGQNLKHELLVGADLGLYYHRNYQTGSWVQGRLSWRRTKLDSKRQRYRSISLGLGYIATWVPNSYLVTQNDIEFQKAKAYSHLLIAPSIEWGKNFKQKLGPFESWYVRPKIQWHIPYFQGSNQYFLFETGLKF